MKAEGKLSGVKRLAEHPVFTPYLVLVILFIISSIAAPTLFPTPRNIVNILRRSSIVGVASNDKTLVLLVGGIDLSVPAVMSLTACLLSDMMKAGMDNGQNGIMLGPVLLNRTTFGRHVYAIGSNAEAARLTGVRVNRNKILTYALCGLTAALAGILLMARVRVGEPNSGSGFEMDALSAAVIGGTAMSGGVGHLSGTFAGVLIMAIMDNILNLVGADPNLQGLIKGAIIYQELNLVPELSAIQNVMLGNEIHKAHFLNLREERAYAGKYLDYVCRGAIPDYTVPVKRLSVAQQQMVEIAKALSYNSKIIIMDEPTDTLTNDEIAVLFEIVRKLKENGITVIYISHRLEELMIRQQPVGCVLFNKFYTEKFRETREKFGKLTALHT